MTTARIPHVQTTRYKIGAMLYKKGPLSRAELFTHIKSGSSTENSARMLRRAIDDGWLTEINGAIYVGAIALSHFGISNSSEEWTPKYVGQAATSRMSSAYDRPPLSKRFIPSSQGFRDDVPAFSVRVGVHFHTQA